MRSSSSVAGRRDPIWRTWSIVRRFPGIDTSHSSSSGRIAIRRSACWTSFVETVAVAGIPESEPIWDSLESEAIQHHTTIKYVNQATRVTVTPHLAVELVPVETTSKTNSEGAIVRVQAGSMRFSWISGISKNSRIPPADPLFDLRANVVIDADGGTWLPEVGTPALSFQPAAARSSAMTKPPSRFARTLDGGDQVQLRFNGNELRLPRGQVTDMHAVGSD